MSTHTQFYSAWEYGPESAIPCGLEEFVQAASQAHNTHMVYLAPEETTFGGVVYDSPRAQEVVEQLKKAVDTQGVQISVVIGKPSEEIHTPAIHTDNTDYSNSTGRIDVLTEIADFVDIVCWQEFFLFWSPSLFMGTMRSNGGIWPGCVLRRNRNIDQLFTLFNGEPHFHRCRLMDQLAKADLIDTNFVTWTKINDAHKFNHWDQQIIQDQSAAYWANGQLQQYSNRNRRYYQTLLDLVPESSCAISVFTENTVRPIVNFKPFLIFGAPGINLKLKELGFEIFEELFDYGFEDCTQDQQRATLIADQLSELQLKHSPDNYSTLYEMVKPKLMHNAEVLCNIMQTGGRNKPAIWNQVKYYLDAHSKNQSWIENFNRYKENNMEQKPEQTSENTHEGSLGTDRDPPSGTEELTQEEIMKRRIEELRKRDPFIYR